MKRNDLVWEITKELNDLYGANCDWNCMPMQIIDKTIEIAERYGMRPPFNSELYYKTWRNGGDGYEWEAE